MRRKHREHTSQPYYDAAYVNAATMRYTQVLPDALRGMPPGLRPYQLRVFEDFAKYINLFAHRAGPNAAAAAAAGATGQAAGIGGDAMGKELGLGMKDADILGLAGVNVAGSRSSQDGMPLGPGALGQPSTLDKLAMVMAESMYIG
jgi:hypothetical protein